MAINLSTLKTRQLGDDTSGANNTVTLAADNSDTRADSFILVRVDAANTVFVKENGVGIDVIGDGANSFFTFPDAPLHVRGQTNSRTARFDRAGTQRLDIQQTASENKIESANADLVLGSNVTDGSINVKIEDIVPFILPHFTTTERDALTPQNGMMIYNSTTGKVQVRESGAWQNVV